MIQRARSLPSTSLSSRAGGQEGLQKYLPIFTNRSPSDDPLIHNIYPVSYTDKGTVPPFGVSPPWNRTVCHLFLPNLVGLVPSTLPNQVHIQPP